MNRWTRAYCPDGWPHFLLLVATATAIVLGPFAALMIGAAL